MEEPPQPQPQPPPPTAARDSRLLGVPVAQRDPEGDAACCAPKLEVAVVDAAVLKRKRGRPAKGAPKVAPPVRQKKDEEDVCFICFDGGSLVLCDRRGCPKAYHPSCIKRDEAFFRSKAKWNCGWHICSVCQKAAHYMCYTCTYSLCKGCIKDADFVCVRENKGMCGICMRTIMLIENSAQGNKEMCEVDFDDKSSWEYLFKVYWIYLKGKLSLTFDELLRAKNQWKGVAPMSCKQSPHELYHLRDDKGSGSENSCIDIESNNLKNKRPRRQPKLLSKGDCLDNWITSGGDSGVSLTDCTKWASKELLEFVAHMKNGDTSLLSQFDVQNLLLEYVKKNNLCDPQQNSQIVCDSRLLNLFGKACVGHMEIPKLLESHFLLRRNGPADNTFGVGIINAVANEGEGHDNYNKQLMLVNDKGCKKDDVLVPQNNPDAYAAIDAHNIKLIYLRRSLMENLTEDIEKIHEKIVGAFVRIRICGGDQKQDMYRLVQVVGTSKVAQPYKIGTRTTDIKLEILNLNRKEVIPIGEISNQEFSEDECKRLRESIKYGLSKRLTVGEILDKALTLQAIRVNDLLEAEILRLNHLRDRASENGHRKEYPLPFTTLLCEYVEKLQLLNSPEERERRLQEIPDVHSDPNLDSMFESDEDDGESDERKQDSNILSKCLGLDRREGGSIFPRNSNSVFNDMGCKTQDLAPTHEPIGNICTPKNPINRDDTAIDDNTNAVVKSEVSSDPTGKIQGPFSMLQLYKWNTTGGFPPDLRIWRIDEKQDNSILLTDALSEKFSKHVSLALNSQLLSLGRKEQKVDNTSTQSDGKDEPVRSNGWHGQLHGYPSLLSTAIPEKLNENSSDKLRKSHGIVGNSKDNGNNGSNRTSDGQSNTCNTSSEQTWRHPNVDSSSNCLVTTSTHVSGTKTSPHKLGFDLDNPPSPPPCNTSSGPTWRHSDINSSSNCLVTTSAHVSACNTSTWQAIIGEPNDFDESVSDLLAEVEAMESLGGLESPTSIMKCNEDLTEGSKNDCLSFVAELSPMLDAGKDVHDHHHQRISMEHSSRSSKIEVGTKNVSVSCNQWDSSSENSPIVPPPATLGLAVDTTWRLGLENTHLGWSGIDQGNANVGWGVGQTAVQENRSSNSYTSVVTPGFGDSQTRYGNDRFSAPRDRGFQGHGRESGFGRSRMAYNRQPSYGVGNGGSYRPLPKGQRVCKFYEGGYCKKGSSCDYWHP
uniref:Zinc finger CCCH domain-containing protein 44 n=1 Tax=Cajanus cajan TaxID=3821 RepID=A0A151TIN0_CAJCA|nr:Zinc finger CCCH domain-containing protein 44 [Cajanus cajan]